MTTDDSTQETARPDGFQFERTWLVRASAVVMVALMLVTTFSVGYWYGSGSSGTAGFAGGPGGQQGGFGAGQQGGPGGGQQGGFGAGQQGGPGGGFGQNALADVLSRQPDLVGQIQSISGGLLTVQTPAGAQALTLTDDTAVFLADGTPGTTEDLEGGLLAAVVGTPEDGGLSMTVDEIAILPARR